MAQQDFWNFGLYIACLFIGLSKKIMVRGHVVHLSESRVLSAKPPSGLGHSFRDYEISLNLIVRRKVGK